MLILDGTLFFHINSKELTMLSSKLAITDLFNNSIYADFTEKSQQETISICAYPSHLGAGETSSTGSANHALKML
jgi:diaminopimelate epimerase